MQDFISLDIAGLGGIALKKVGQTTYLKENVLIFNSVSIIRLNPSLLYRREGLKLTNASIVKKLLYLRKRTVSFTYHAVLSFLPPLIQR